MKICRKLLIGIAFLNFSCGQHPRHHRIKVDAGQLFNEDKPLDLADKVLATWGSSVCDGVGADRGKGWTDQLEKYYAAGSGPQLLHRSTPGHKTDSKESRAERNKVLSANYAIICLSLGNQGLARARSESQAKRVIDSYLDDIFWDVDPADGDPVSMVSYLRSIGVTPIITLAYGNSFYQPWQCEKLVQANILQQSLGVPSINHLGSTNASNSLQPNDCRWADGANGTLDAKNDFAHPNNLGHTENFFAFPPDLIFALAGGKPQPQRSIDNQGFTITRNNHRLFFYQPDHEMHSYTLQFGYKTGGNGVIGMVDVGDDRSIYVSLLAGKLRLHTNFDETIIESESITNDGLWHDVAVTYSYVRQKISLYSDGLLVREQSLDRNRPLFPLGFLMGGDHDQSLVRPDKVSYRDLFVNRVPLHALEVKERATTSWLGSGSLDIYAPIEASDLLINRAQTQQKISFGLYPRGKNF